MFRRSARSITSLHRQKEELAQRESQLRDEVERLERLIAAGVFYINLRGNFEGGSNRTEVMAQDAEEKPNRHGFWRLATTGLSTSIDALAVGVGLAFLNVDILTVAAAIGLTTFAAVTVGVMLGRVIDSLENRAEL